MTTLTTINGHYCLIELRKNANGYDYAVRHAGAVIASGWIAETKEGAKRAAERAAIESGRLVRHGQRA
jgi:hypothetical protein